MRVLMGRGAQGVYGNSVPSIQLCCESKTALKTKQIKKLTAKLKEKISPSGCCKENGVKGQEQRQ